MVRAPRQPRLSAIEQQSGYRRAPTAAVAAFCRLPARSALLYAVVEFQRSGPRRRRHRSDCWHGQPLPTLTLSFNDVSTAGTPRRGQPRQRRRPARYRGGQCERSTATLMPILAGSRRRRLVELGHRHDELINVAGDMLSNMASGPAPTTAAAACSTTAARSTIQGGSTILDNIANGTSGSGGGVFSLGGSLTVTNSHDQRQRRQPRRRRHRGDRRVNEHADQHSAHQQRRRRSTGNG